MLKFTSSALGGLRITEPAESNLHDPPKITITISITLQEQHPASVGALALAIMATIWEEGQAHCLFRWHLEAAIRAH